MDEIEDSAADARPVWAIFGDLMSGLVGVFVLVLIWTLGFQVELAQSLKTAVDQRQAEQQRRLALEHALSGPLAQGRVTLRNGRIGISGSVLFARNSDRLQPEGRTLLNTLVDPLRTYLGDRDELLMISGFTDDLTIHADNGRFDDNWELSAQRALTVTRALIDAGMPERLVFAAAFGENYPVTANRDEASRSRNRRVEIAPVPKQDGRKEPP